MKIDINIPALKPTNLVGTAEIPDIYVSEDGFVDLQWYLVDHKLTLGEFYKSNCSTFEENDNFEHDDNDIVIKESDIIYVEANKK